MDKNKKKNIDHLFTRLTDLIKESDDEEIKELLGDGNINNLLLAIHPEKITSEQTIYDYFLENKNRLYLLALIRYAITLNTSLSGTLDVGKKVFISPMHIQWYDDGVMFTQGVERYSGSIALYKKGNLSFSVSSRDINEGENMEKEDLFFIEYDKNFDYSKSKLFPESSNELEKAYNELKYLLDNKIMEENKYQDFLKNHPWTFGAQYKQIDSHKNFDDNNIPDFTGVRVRDGSRDIFEIKQPFLPLFQSKNKFRSEFNNAWNQIEQYYDFARNHSEYLYKEKGLYFENPVCYLIVGYNLSRDQIKCLRRKERMNPAITILTYNDFLALIKNTIKTIKNLKELTSKKT